MPSFPVLRSLEVFLSSDFALVSQSQNRPRENFCADKIERSVHEKKSDVHAGIGRHFVRPRNHPRRQFADTVVSYTQGTLDPNYGELIMTQLPRSVRPSQAHPANMARPVDPFDPPYLHGQIVGVGTGGSLTLQFNTPILNNPGNPSGIDFIIFGHTGFNIRSTVITAVVAITDGSIVHRRHG